MALIDCNTLSYTPIKKNYHKIKHKPVKMSNTQPSALAIKFAKQIMEAGRYGGGDDTDFLEGELDDIEYDSPSDSGMHYGGWYTKLTKQQKKTMFIVGGVSLAVILVGAVVGGAVWYKKRQDSKQ